MFTRTKIPDNTVTQCYCNFELVHNGQKPKNEVKVSICSFTMNVINLSEGNSLVALRVVHQPKWNTRTSEEPYGKFLQWKKTKTFTKDLFCYYGIMPAKRHPFLSKLNSTILHFDFWNFAFEIFQLYWLRNLTFFGGIAFDFSAVWINHTEHV